MKRFISILLMVLLIGSTYSQEGTQPESARMADLMRSNGKIYVVVAVVVTILIGLFIYLFRLDRKIRRIEKGLNEH
jgi:uncharacterized membrane protein YwaF